MVLAVRENNSEETKPLSSRTIFSFHPCKIFRMLNDFRNIE